MTQPRTIERRDRTREWFRDVRDIAPVVRGLGALWHSDRGLTLNGLATSALFDEAGGGASLVQGTGSAQPTVVPNVIGVRTALRFDGGNDVLACPIVNGLQPSSRGLTAVFVAQGRAGSTGDYPVIMSARAWTASLEHGWAICANGSAVGGFMSAHYADGTTGFDNPGVASRASRGLSLVKRELWCVVFDDTNNKLRYYRNGALDIEQSPTFPTNKPVSPVPFQLGAAPPPAATRWASMDFFAGAVHTEPLTAEEVGAYAARWMPLYGVTP